MKANILDHEVNLPETGCDLNGHLLLATIVATAARVHSKTTPNGDGSFGGRETEQMACACGLVVEAHAAYGKITNIIAKYPAQNN